MIPLEIHDRGRGPELKGTRLTVYDIIPYRLAGDSPEQIAEVFRHGYADLTAAHIELLFCYMDGHYDDVMAVHWKIEERHARGNPPEIEQKLREGRARFLAKLSPELRARYNALFPDVVEVGPASGASPVIPADHPVGG